MASTKDVINHHYVPDAVLFTSDRPLSGTDWIKWLFQAMVAEFGKPETKKKMPKVALL